MEEYWNFESNIEMAKGCRKAYDKEGIKGIYKYLINYDFQKGFDERWPHVMAEKYALLGEKEKALDWLEKAFEQHNIGPNKNNLYFKNIETEPRFIAILEKMGLADK